MPHLIRFTAAVALVSVMPVQLALLLAVIGAWVVFDLVQPE